MCNEGRQSATVCLPDTLEAVLESGKETASEAGRRSGDGKVGQQMTGHRWYQRSRQEIGGHHREHHSQGQRWKKISSYPRQQHHGKKYDANRKRADQRGRGDLRSALQNRSDQGLAWGMITMNVLDLHSRIID